LLSEKYVVREDVFVEALKISGLTTGSVKYRIPGQLIFNKVN